MDHQKLIKLNRLISAAYECLSFTEFLKLAIFKLHELIPYESGMFFCAISRDCSFFKPYAGDGEKPQYEKQPFLQREEYLKQKEEEGAGGEALVYKALDYRQGAVLIASEPRSGFLASQEDFHIACVRIVYKGQFMGEIYLHRSKHMPDFDEEDMFTLRLLQPHISIVFHIIHTIAAVHALETEGGRLSKRGLLLLDEELSLISGNAIGYEMLKTSTVFGSSIFYHVKALCEDMLGGVKCSAPIYRSERIKTGGGGVLVDAVFYRRSGAKKCGQFFLFMEYEYGEQAVADYKFKFTKREMDIIDGVIQGKNNAQLADALNVSENTIKTHIRNIYRKAGANNRTELAYILMMSQSAQKE